MNIIVKTKCQISLQSVLTQLTSVVKRGEKAWLELTWNCQLYLEPDLSWVEVFS